MPKKTKHPGLRRHSWTTAQGERVTAYYFEQRTDGKRREIPLGTDHAEALKKWHALRFEKPLEAGTIKEAFDKYAAEVLPDKTPTTQRNYLQSISKLRPVFGHMRWDDVKVPMIAEYLKRRTAKVQANREKAVLSVVWGHAREWGMTELPFPAYKMKLKNHEAADNIDFTDAMFAAAYVHAEPFLRRAMDLISASAWRIRDALKCRLTDVRGDVLPFVANKTKKKGKLALDDPQRRVIPNLIAERREAKVPHVFMLWRGNAPVTERMLTDAWKRARAKAVKDCPDLEGVYLRHVRHYAGQLAGSLQEAQQLLQHGSAATTQRHYRPGEKLRPVR